MAYWFVAGKKFVGLRTLGICENTFSCAKIVIPRQEFCANDQATLHCSTNVKCFSSHMGLSENGVPLHPMVLLIIIPFLNGYFIGGIPFSDKPIVL